MSTTIQLNTLTVSELRDISKKQGVKGYSKMNKTELVKALSNSQKKEVKPVTSNKRYSKLMQVILHGSLKERINFVWWTSVIAFAIIGIATLIPTLMGAIEGFIPSSMLAASSTFIGLTLFTMSAKWIYNLAIDRTGKTWEGYSSVWFFSGLVMLLGLAAWAVPGIVQVLT